jgi:hypothetical protein
MEWKCARRENINRLDLLNLKFNMRASQYVLEMFVRSLINEKAMDLVDVG